MIELLKDMLIVVLLVGGILTAVFYALVLFVLIIKVWREK